MKHITPLLLVAIAGCAAPTALPLAGPAWFQLDDSEPESDVLTGYVLRAGRIGGAATVRIELPPEAFAEGPYALPNGVTPDTPVVLFGHNDGARSALEIVDVDTGARRVLVESSAVLRRAIVDVDGDALYVLALDQETRAELGVYRFPLDAFTDAIPVGARLDAPEFGRVRGLEDGELVLPGMPREKVGEELFGPTFATLLAVDRSSGALVVQSCGEILCRARSLDLASGDVTLRDEIGQGEMVGVVDGTLVAYEAGNGLPCKVLAIDVATGAARTIAHAYGAVFRADEATLVFESGDEPGVLLARTLEARDDEPSKMLGVFDVTGGNDGNDDALHPVLDAARSNAGVDLPAGLVALGTDGRVAPVHASPDTFFVRLNDGALFATAEATHAR
jgi:hypothetical protein